MFLKFILTCLDYYGLDRYHYFHSTGLSWDAMLKMTEIELELISNIDMYLFFEKGMRGGISYIAKRFRKANNKYKQPHDNNKPSKCIMYFDANNLYGWEMIRWLPYNGFKWLNQKEIDKLDLNSIGEIVQ